MTGARFAPGPRVSTADGVEIATYDLGGEGPPVVLAHATGLHGRVWLPLASSLRPHVHCWAFDSRGHGDSGPAPDGNYAWSGFASDVEAVVDGLGLERPLAVGHSSGGAALLLAEAARPGSFSALYCYEPVVFTSRETPDPPGGNPLAQAARRRREVFESRRAARDNYAAKAPFSDFDPAALEAYVEWAFHDLPDGTVRLACRCEDEARVYEAAGHNRVFERLSQVACPVTVACGGRHAHFSREAMSAVASGVPRGAPLEVHDHMGHFGPLERPAEIGSSILAAFAAMALD